jgi:hypothetical protein
VLTVSSTVIPDPSDTSGSLPEAKIVGEVEEVIRDENATIIGPYQVGYVRCWFKPRRCRSWYERVLDED